jgi:NAD(P) transhydrogenase
MKDLMFRVGPVVRHEIDVIRHQLLRNGVELLYAEASLVEEHTLELRFADGHSQGRISGEGYAQRGSPKVAADVC